MLCLNKPYSLDRQMFYFYLHYRSHHLENRQKTSHIYLHNQSISSIVNLEYMFLSAIQTKHGYVVSGLLDKEETNTSNIITFDLSFFCIKRGMMFSSGPSPVWEKDRILSFV